MKVMYSGRLRARNPSLIRHPFCRVFCIIQDTLVHSPLLSTRSTRNNIPIMYNLLKCKLHSSEFPGQKRVHIGYRRRPFQETTNPSAQQFEGCSPHSMQEMLIFPSEFSKRPVFQFTLPPLIVCFLHKQTGSAPRIMCFTIFWD